MKTFCAFFRKEWTEQLRTGRVTIFSILFILFGIMNPALAKLTPWMMQLFSDELAKSGMTVKNVEITALTSWTQFYKNIPMVLIVFVLLTCGSFTAEYQKGTLILVLTKGLSRVKVLAAKAFMTFLLWTAGFFLCYFITYGYTAYFWDNSIAQHLLFGAFCYYLFGVWVVSLMVLFSAFFSNNTGVLAGTGGVVFVSYLLNLLPKCEEYLPMRLTNSMPLLTGQMAAGEMLWAIGITCALIVLNLAVSVPVFNKRSL
jgi:ABC-2 type transport system permease protein